MTRSLTPHTFRLVSLVTAVLLILAGLLTSRSAKAGTDQKATAFVLCKSQKSVRTIRIIPEKADNCTITYSKNGSEEVVGANRSVQTCKSILKSIESHLESANWNCRNVESAHLMTSSEAGSLQ